MDFSLAFKRFIAAVLILSLAGLTTAWAFDAHDVDAAAHGEWIDTAGSADHPDADGHAYDHCCHAGAHLAGLSNTPQPLVPVIRSVLQSPTPADLFLARTTAPPFKPPRS
jgi:hypothetical protein